ncbi:MAG: ADP-ribosylglycohydrolase family protein, partial [Okeania sp. SIO2H7]|nr:ADP-ribosylglycohydrolase family protein [Okeania sp. SIO2H7]
MKYSLLSQFKGALLGAVVGGFIGQELSIAAGSFTESLSNSNSDRNSFQDLEKNPSRIGEIALISARSLIKCEGLELEDWQESLKQWQNTQLVQYLNWETGIASIPVAMLYHEDEVKLREKFNQIAEVWQGNLDVKLNNLAIGYTIALGLQEKLDPGIAIPKTIFYLKEESPLVELLTEVQSLLEKQVDLKTAIVRLSKKANEMKELSKEASTTAWLISLPLAFYCFLSTPENWQLAVLRAARIRQGPQICAIVGAISGAYNSMVGIPVEWRRIVDARIEKTSTMAKVAAREAEIIELAKSLWALWCGVYNPETMENQLNLVPAVAASNVI